MADDFENDVAAALRNAHVRATLLDVLEKDEGFRKVVTDWQAAQDRKRRAAAPKFWQLAFWKQSAIWVPVSSVASVLALVGGLEYMTAFETRALVHSALATERHIAGLISEDKTTLADALPISLQGLIDKPEGEPMRLGIHKVMAERPVIVSHGLQGFAMFPPNPEFPEACRTRLKALEDEAATVAETLTELETARKLATEAGRPFPPVQQALLAFTRGELDDIAERELDEQRACYRETPDPQLVFTFYADFANEDRVRARVRVMKTRFDESLPTAINFADAAKLSMSMTSISQGLDDIQAVEFEFKDDGILEVPLSALRSGGGPLDNDKIHRLIVTLDRSELPESTSNYLVSAAFLTNL